MIQAKCLKRRLECMVQVKTEENHEYNIQYGIKLISKKQCRHLVKVMLCNTFRWTHPSKFYKIEIEKMNAQENENYRPCMNHIF